MSKIIPPVVAVIIVMSANQLTAGVIVFSDRTAWRAAAGGGTGDLTEDFGAGSDIPYPTTAGFLSFTPGGNAGISSNHKLDGPLFGDPSVNGTRHAILRTFDDSFNTTVSFSSVSAIGFDYINSTSGSMNFTTSLGDALIIPNSLVVDFYGIVYDSGESITSLHFDDPNDLSYRTDDWEAFSSASTAVPEPSSLVLLGMGACGFIGYSWRRRKRGVDSVA